MHVIVSNWSKTEVYHQMGCGHIQRIKKGCRIQMSEKEAKRWGYRHCRHCKKLKGSLAGIAYSFENEAKKRKLELTYNRGIDTIYIRSAKGFWKVCRTKESELMLWHLNNFNGEKSTEELIRGKFHRQTDVPLTKSLGEILEYVKKHDAAKAIIEEDYRKLPKRTKKEKMYYKKAKRRTQKRQVKRVLDMIDALAKAREEKEAMTFAKEAV